MNQDGKFLESVSAPVKVYRIIEYCGPQEWVDNTLRRSLNGKYKLSIAQITAITLSDDQVDMLPLQVIYDLEGAEDGSWAWTRDGILPGLVNNTGKGVE